MSGRSGAFACLLFLSAGCYSSTYARSPDGGETGFVDGTSDETGMPTASMPTASAGAVGEESGAPSALGGEELFNLNCAGCHGPEGVGTELAYEIQHPVFEHAEYVVRNGRVETELEGEMPAFGPEQLSDDELAEILDYLSSFPNPETGEELFFDYCRNCHGENATGLGSVTAGPSLLGRDFDHILDQVRDGEEAAVSARTEYMPAWDAGALTTEEVQAIATYVQSL